MRRVLGCVVLCAALLPGQDRAAERVAQEHRQIVLGIAQLRAELYARGVLDKGDAAIETLLVAALPVLARHENLRKGEALHLLAALRHELPDPGDPPEDATGSERAVRESLVRMAGPLRFDDSGPRGWVRYLEATTGTNILLDREVELLDPDRVTLRDFALPEMPAIDAVSVLCTAMGLEYGFRHGVLAIRPTPRPHESPEQSTERLAEIRRSAGEVTTALGMLGGRAQPAVPALRSLTEHADAQLAARARAALRLILRER